MTKHFLKSFFVIFCFLLFSSCRKAKPVEVVPTPTPKLVEIELQDRPEISLIPRADGHELKLKLENIPDIISQIEYELIYTATDDDLEIEKGLAGTIEVDSPTVFRDLLLGTASCTNGCKYKYDTGVTGGSLHLSFVTKKNQIALFDTDFILTTSADIRKNGLQFQDLVIQANPQQNEYFVVLKNYNQNYAIFSSGSGLATIKSVNNGYTNTTKDKLTGIYVK